MIGVYNEPAKGVVKESKQARYLLGYTRWQAKYMKLKSTGGIPDPDVT